jgi:hypothetical protein
MERILKELQELANDKPGTLFESKLNEAITSLKMDALQTAIANALITWALAQQPVQGESGKPGAVVDWVDMGNRVLMILGPASQDGKSSTLEGIEAASAVTLIDWAIKQPKIIDMSGEGLLSYVDIGQSIITSGKKGEAKDLGAEPPEAALKGAPKPEKEPKPEEKPVPGAEEKPGEPPAGAAPEEEEGLPAEAKKAQAKYALLAEKLFIIKYLKERGAPFTDKEKSFITETEKLTLTEKEREVVKQAFDELVKKATTKKA